MTDDERQDHARARLLISLEFGASGVCVRPGITVCVASLEGAVSVVGCDETRQVRVDCDTVPSSDSEITMVVEHALVALRDADFIDPGTRDPDRGSEVAFDGELTTDLDKCAALVDDPDRPGIIVFAGRCLSLSTGESPFERRTALRRFLAGSQARVVAQCCLVGEGQVIVAEPPRRWRDAPDGLAIFENGGWAAVKVGGGLGPLGTSRTLRTWTAGPVVISTSACHLRLTSPATAEPMIGGSVGVDAAATEVPAIAEACERYLGGIVDPGRLLEASMVELGADAIDPRSVVDYAPWQFQQFEDLHPFNAAERRLWVDVKGTNGSERFALADLVFYPFGSPHNRLHTGTTSSGMAAHTSLEAALGGAVNELIERDAFMRMWLGRRPGRRLLGWRSTIYRPVVDELEDKGWSLEVLQIGVDRNEPVLMAVGSRGQQFALGASAGEPHAAVTKAMFELWTTVNDEGENSIGPGTLDPDLVSSPSEHAQFALSGQYESPPVFVGEYDGTVPIGDLHDRPTWPEDVYFYEWDALLSRPFHVVRALIPSLIPISFGRGREPYGRADVEALAGKPLPFRLSDCPEPHPFP